MDNESTSLRGILIFFNTVKKFKINFFINKLNIFKKFPTNYLINYYPKLVENIIKILISNKNYNIFYITL